MDALPLKTYARSTAARALERSSALGHTARTARKLRRRALLTPRHQSGTIELDGFEVSYFDLLSTYMEYKDLFGHRVYHFDSASPAPRVIDGGAYIGMASLYFKSVYPAARITAFEPDPEIHATLDQNVRQNNLTGVETVCAALAAREGSASFHPDGADGGRLTDEGGQTVQAVKLSDYLAEPVDFLKLNIEGFELDVLQEAEPALGNVHELVLEYHGWPDGEQRLGPILDLLDRNGFRYLVNHMDYETNGGVRPPFHIPDRTPWFALVYASFES